jgi:hypothetical protein
MRILIAFTFVRDCEASLIVWEATCRKSSFGLRVPSFWINSELPSLVSPQEIIETLSFSDSLILSFSQTTDFGVCREGLFASKGTARTRAYRMSNYFVVLVNPGEAFTHLHREAAFQELVQFAKKSGRNVDFVHSSCLPVLQKPVVDRMQAKLASSQSKMLSNMCCGHEIGNCSHFKPSTSLILWPALFLSLPVESFSPSQSSPLTLPRPVVDKMRSSSHLPLMIARMKCLSVKTSCDAAAWTHRRLLSFFQKSHESPQASQYLLLEGICVTDNLAYFRSDSLLLPTLRRRVPSSDDLTEEEALSTEDDRLSLSHILHEDVVMSAEDEKAEEEYSGMGKTEDAVTRRHTLQDPILHDGFSFVSYISDVKSDLSKKHRVFLGILGDTLHSSLFDPRDYSAIVHSSDSPLIQSRNLTHHMERTCEMYLKTLPPLWNQHILDPIRVHMNILEQQISDRFRDVEHSLSRGSSQMSAYDYRFSMQNLLGRMESKGHAKLQDLHFSVDSKFSVYFPLQDSHSLPIPSDELESVLSHTSHELTVALQTFYSELFHEIEAFFDFLSSELSKSFHSISGSTLSSLSSLPPSTSSSGSSSSPKAPSLLPLFAVNSEDRKIVQSRKNELKRHLDRLGLALGGSNRSSHDHFPVELTSDDANIQYRTVALQLYGTENAFQIVRTLVFNEILSSESVYLPYLEGSSLSLTEYVAYMMRDGVYGDHVTLCAAANAFETDIYVVTPLSPNPFIFRSRNSSPSGVQPLLLCMVSAREYYSLVWKTPKKSSAVDVTIKIDNLSRDELARSVEGDRKRSKSSVVGVSGRQSPKMSYFSGMTTLVDLCIQTIGWYSEMLPPLDGLLPPELLQRILSHLLRIRVMSEGTLEKILDETVQSLDVSASPQITDRMCDIIARRCPNLQILSLANCANVTNEGLRAISHGCPQLESLDLEKLSSITDDGIRVLAQGCPNLSSVNLSGCSQITNAALSTLYHSGQNLQALSLNGLSQITDPVFDLIHGITRLDLSDCQQLTDTAVERIAMNTHTTLESLVLQGGHFTDAGVCKLAMSCGRLTDLRISDCAHVTFETLRSLATSCRYLRTLSLRNCVNIIGETGRAAEEKSSAPASLWRCLESVDLDFCTNVSDHTVLFIAKRSPKLKSLTLSSCNLISDLSVECLPLFCKDLERISLSNCVLISDKAVGSLSSLPRLTSLNLHNCNRITNQAVFSLALHARKLTKLDISWCRRLSDDAILQLRDGVRGIEELSLEELSISPYAVSALSSHCEMLRSLNLAYTNTDADSLLRLAKGCSHLCDLDVTGCRSLSIENLNVAIEYLPNLRVLRVRWMDCLRSLAVSHARLETLDVSFCKYFDRDGLMGVLHTCPSLQHVDVAWCTSLSPVDIYDFARFSRHLRSMNLRGHPPLPPAMSAGFLSKGIEIFQ